MSDLAAVIMAAGLGTRMKSATPKHLHPLLGRRLIDWVVGAVEPLRPDPLVLVVAPDAVDAFDGANVAVQEKPLGTGDSLRAARDKVDDAKQLLVVSGDHPRLSSALLQQLVDEHRRSGVAATVLSFEPPDPLAYGRIVRGGDGRLRQIVENADADEEQRAIREVNSSIYVFEADRLWPALDRIEPANAQGELYLTDAVRLLVEGGEEVGVFKAPDASEVEGVNTRVELADAALFLRARVNKHHMLAGVTIVDPQTTWIEPEVELEADSTIHPFTILRGKTRVAAGAEVGPHVVAVDAEIGPGATVGPFAYLRPGTRLAAGAKAGPSSRSRTPRSASARRFHTSPTSAMPRSARTRTSPPATSRELSPSARSPEGQDEDRTQRQDRHSQWLRSPDRDRGRRMDCGRGVHNRRCPSRIARWVPAEADHERGLSPWKAQRLS
jgi:bifunctional UDP-N-acetylglucosamine pyrophosphorylase/glucosamine-1-phosphate N-acetyltransferase